MAFIVVVDDEPNLLLAFKEALKSDGHEVLGFNCPAEALVNLTASLRPDLVITDYSMPQMNGAEFALQLRGKGYDGPIMMLTADTRIAGCPKGVDIVRHKPINVATLRILAKQLVRRGRPVH